MYLIWLYISIHWYIAQPFFMWKIWVSTCLKVRSMACRHVQVLSILSPLSCKSLSRDVVGGIENPGRKSLSCHFCLCFTAREFITRNVPVWPCCCRSASWIWVSKLKHHSLNIQMGGVEIDICSSFICSIILDTQGIQSAAASCIYQTCWGQLVFSPPAVFRRMWFCHHGSKMNSWIQPS